MADIKSNHSVIGNFYRINLFKNLYSILSDRSEELRRKLKRTIILLEELESLINDSNLFFEKLISNINMLNNDRGSERDDDLTLFTELLLIIEKDSSTKSMLNQVFAAIDKYLKIDNYFKLFKEVHDKTSSKKLVFLSYAYLDKSYTVGLFYYFFKKDIYLYVDWMHNEKILEGDVLKNKLSEILKKSNQFLFLDTVNSQLSMRGNYNIRQWCAWEVGNYFNFKINENRQRKFYLSIYYENQLSRRKKNNLMLDDFKPLKGVSNGYIY